MAAVARVLLSVQRWRANWHALLSPQSHREHQFPELDFANYGLPQTHLQPTNTQTGIPSTLDELIGAIWNMGVPKSKVSQSRKKMKHARYFPDAVHTIHCERCGEQKKPHRMCTTHKEICVMREEDWLAKKAQMDRDKADASA